MVYFMRNFPFLIPLIFTGQLILKIEKNPSKKIDLGTLNLKYHRGLKILVNNQKKQQGYILFILFSVEKLRDELIRCYERTFQ